MSRNQVAKVIAVVVGWRLALALLAAAAPSFLPYQPSFPYYDTLLMSSGLPPWLYSWANFDGVHYLTIVAKGYVGTASIQAFFPLYPGAVWVAQQVVQQPIVAGLIVANVALVIAAVLWFSLMKQVMGEKEAWLSLIFLLLFPTSFFLGAMYGESIFLCWVLGSLLAAQQKRWWLAGLLAAAASATRVVGVLLVPTLWLVILEFNLAKTHPHSLESWKGALRKSWQKQKTAFAWVSIGVAGLLGYMWYLQRAFNDALYFFHVQADFGGIRQETLVLYPQVLWRATKIVATFRPINWQYYTFLQEFLVGTLVLVILLLAFKKIRWSYAFFSLAVFLVPTLTGTFSSLPRYVLVCLSLYMWLALVLKSRPWALALYLVCSGLLLSINTILFIQGYWVA